MKKLLSILFILFLFFGCDPKDDEDDKIPHPDEGGTALVDIENPMGFAEAASCLKRGDINLTVMDAEYKQLNNYTTTTWNDLGAYTIEADVSGVKARTSFRGYCFRETADGYVYMSMDVYHDLAAEMNVNIPGTIQGDLSTRYKDDVNHPAYNNRELALSYAKDDILDYFGFGGYKNIDFSIASIQGDTTNDSVAAIISSVVDSRHDTGPEMNDDISTIARGIYTGDLALKSEIVSNLDSLKIKDIKNRVTGIAGSCPPIWELDFLPEYYSDILNRTPEIVQSFNMDGNSQCVIDNSNYNSFSYPFVYNPTEPGKYLASELSGDISVWSVGICNQGTDYFCPLTELVTVAELNEILLEPVMNYNGFLGDHGLVAGNQYFIVQNFEVGTATSHVCDGELVPFGRNLATVDNNWSVAVGYDNVTNFFRRSIKWYITN